jgi:transcriptional regulator with XRE-family HTH domain
MPESFGQMLRRLRLAKTVTTVTTTVRGRVRRTTERTTDLSQNELAFRTGITAGAVWRLEDGSHIPRRETIIALAEALELDEAATDRLFIAAGYWPWDLEDAAIDALVLSMRGADEAEPIDIRRRTG